MLRLALAMDLLRIVNNDLSHCSISHSASIAEEADIESTIRRVVGVRRKLVVYLYVTDHRKDTFPQAPIDLCQCSIFSAHAP